MADFRAVAPIRADFDAFLNNWPMFFGTLAQTTPSVVTVVGTEFTSTYRGSFDVSQFGLSGTLNSIDVDFTQTGADFLDITGLSLDIGEYLTLLNQDIVSGTERVADLIAEQVDEAAFSAFADRFVEISFNTIDMGAGEDVVLLRGRGSRFDGGPGDDSAEIRGDRADFVLAEGPGGIIAISDAASGSGFANSLLNFESLAFRDTVIDISNGLPGIGKGLSVEDARTVALLFEAALDRNGQIRLEGLNFWIDAREDGLSEERLAELFLESPEFRTNFGEPFDASSPDFLTNRELVEVLFRNVLDREGRGPGIDFWTRSVADPDFSRADLLIAFAESPENLAGSPFVEDLIEVSPGEWDFV